MYIYDAKTNGFYAVLLKESYELAGTWPKAGVEVTEEEHKALMDGQSTGKVVSADSEGKPVLADIEIDYVALATAERDRRSAAVTARINELVEAQDDGDITDAEQQELAALRDSRTKLRRLDLTKAPDIDWPDCKIQPIN
ncbi:tail fiber assembly protein [Salmonella enterica]|nr:phage tail protein [Salmonella enterica]EBF7092647.1 tail fiber assembly protein [Salmonella enterica subsp. enterica serovar Liverpool]EDE1791138.1 phage tail protein [Salmonella enterica subsp. enterica serovar Enteritidis]EKE4415037.1 tail fiber assembly protein [Salmonella enterica subsp. enterica serovar Meleagridis]MBE9968162.1 tail fiber assembly protein [Citrobacter freundii]HBJ6802850.1 tail fiber assembly protein [Salmonella enterica subsp. enterica serovar Anatum]